MAITSFFNWWEEDSPNDTSRNFKLINIRLSTMSLAGRWQSPELPFRTVFDSRELTDRLMIGFSFHNRRQSTPWRASVLTRCYKWANGNWVLLCALNKEQSISPAEDVVYIENGWKPQPGTTWESGQYIWDIYINDQLVGRQNFCVNNMGAIASTIPTEDYVSKAELRFTDGAPGTGHLFGNEFGQATTLDIHYNINLTLALKKACWFELSMELYRNGSFLQLNYSPVFAYDGNPKPGDENFSNWVTTNLYADRGQWQEGEYICKVKCLGTQLVSGTFFIRSQKDIKTTPVPVPTQAVENNATQNSPQGVEDFLKELDELIGMDNVKKDIRNHINYLNFLQLRRAKGFDESAPITLHSVFTGNPGTGKTTVIRLLGKIYQSMGLLSKGHVINADRSVLVGEWIGHTAPKTKKAIEEARGGILFIDEAYSLAKKGMAGWDFGQEVIEILLQEMTNPTGDLAVICAGYPEPMNEFLESNPGLKSRFNHYYAFQDYLPEELLKICEYSARKGAVIFSPSAKEFLMEKLIDAYRDRDEHFGNARFAHSLVTDAKFRMGQRLMKHPDLQHLSDEQLSTIEKADIEEVFAREKNKQVSLKIDEKLLAQGLAQLNALTGMDNIKQDVNDWVKLVRFYMETGKEFLGKFSLHSIFTGNPGTGKTTVARIMATIYKALGLLERGHLVEVDRESLVSGFDGQTAIKTGEKITEAMGGVLFIDEAYALVQKNAFSQLGNEAIQVILKRMEDHRGKFAIIAAGYTENMNEFLESNPGLKSRFDRTLHFYDYTPPELFQIAVAIAADEKRFLSPEAARLLQQQLEKIYNHRDEHFGNARTIRKLMSHILKRQDLRMASMESSQRTKEKMETITEEDLFGLETLSVA